MGNALGNASLRTLLGLDGRRAGGGFRCSWSSGHDSVFRMLFGRGFAGAANDALARALAGTGVGPRPLSAHGQAASMTHTPVGPEVQTKLSGATSAYAEPEPLNALRHLEQWQLRAFINGADTSYRTAPQKQAPVVNFTLTSSAGATRRSGNSMSVHFYHHGNLSWRALGNLRRSYRSL